MSAFLDKPLDDMKASDIAIGFAEIFDNVANHFASEGDSGWEGAMTRAAATARVWAKFGAWYTREDLRNVARHAVLLALAPTGSIDFTLADRAVEEYLKKGRHE